MSKLTKDNARTERRRNRSKRAQNNISNRPRFVVSRSLKNIQGQIIDDINGKTLLSVQIALDMFFKRQVDKIIITRPTISTEDNGFLPGSEREKMEPWLVPIRSNMRKIYNKPETLERMEKDESIELVSLAHFRGRTFENSIVIVDEFQNCLLYTLRMALGRLGKNSTMIFCGDNQQIDLKDSNYSAIHDIAKIVESEYVYKRILLDNHRHEAIDDVFERLTGM